MKHPFINTAFFLYTTIITLFPLLPVSLSKHISFNISKSFFAPHIKNEFSFGSSHNYFTITTNTPFTLIVNDDFSNHEHKDAELIQSNTSITIHNYPFNADVYKRSITYQNKTLFDNFYYYVINITNTFIIDKDNPIFSGFGFAYKFPNENFSFIHQLYNNNHISKKQFTFMRHSKNEDGVIYFGELPPEIKHTYNYRNNIKIKCDNNYDKWGNTLTSIKINNKEYAFNQYAQFHLSEYSMIKSKKFMDIICNDVLNEYIGNNKECLLRYKYEGCKVLTCTKSVIDNIGNISFIIDNKEITLPFNKLFLSISNQYQSEFGYNINNDNNNNNEQILNFGFPFAMLFSAVTFDYDNGDITLALTNPEIKIKTLYNKHINQIYNVIIILCIIFIVYLIRVKKYFI